MTDLSGKTALITGGRSGIGAAIAETLKAKGATVLTAQRGTDHANDHIETNLADLSAPDALIAEAIDRLGRLDILINNAGVMHEGTLLEMDVESWTQTLQVNLTAPALLIKAALPYLIDTKGCILNIGSIEGLGSNPRHPAYCASKGGLHALTRAVAVDHGPDGVRCNALAPGWIDTDLNTAFIESLGDPEQFRKDIGRIHPVGRTGTPQEVANLGCWLVSDEASFVTGQIWTIDGGRMSKLSLP